MIDKKVLLEVKAHYGKSIMWSLKKDGVNKENIALKLNEIFMAGQNGIDKTWKQVTSKLEKDTEREQLYIKVKLDGIWLTRTTIANVKLKDIPAEHERMTTSIMRSLDQLLRGEPWDDDVQAIRDEGGKFDQDL